MPCPGSACLQSVFVYYNLYDQNEVVDCTKPSFPIDIPRFILKLIDATHFGDDDK
jgi:hypothetical protein